jgi:hypothetical protein
MVRPASLPAGAGPHVLRSRPSSTCQGCPDVHQTAHSQCMTNPCANNCGWAVRIRHAGGLSPSPTGPAWVRRPRAGPIPTSARVQPADTRGAPRPVEGTVPDEMVTVVVVPWPMTRIDHLEPPERIFVVYTWYVPGIYFCKKHIRYIPGIFQENDFQIKLRFYQFECAYVFGVYFQYTQWFCLRVCRGLGTQT